MYFFSIFTFIVDPKDLLNGAIGILSLDFFHIFMILSIHLSKVGACEYERDSRDVIGGEKISGKINRFLAFKNKSLK